MLGLLLVRPVHPRPRTVPQLLAYLLPLAGAFAFMAWFLHARVHPAFETAMGGVDDPTLQGQLAAVHVGFWGLSAFLALMGLEAFLYFRSVAARR